MSLKQQVRDWLLKKVFRDPGRPKAKRALAAGSNPFAWSVLVLDSTTLRIVQSCFQGLNSIESQQTFEQDFQHIF